VSFVTSNIVLMMTILRPSLTIRPTEPQTLKNHPIWVSLSQPFLT
jgi:hypothetical protein